MNSRPNLQLTAEEFALIGQALEREFNKSPLTKTEFYALLSSLESKNKISESTIRKAFQGKTVKVQSLKVIAVKLGFSSLNELFFLQAP